MPKTATKKATTPGKAKPGPLPAKPRAPGAPYSVAQAADALNVSVRLVRQYLEQGVLEGYREGAKGKLWRIPEAVVDAYLAKRQGKAGGARPAGTFKHLKGRGA